MGYPENQNKMKKLHLCSLALVGLLSFASELSAQPAVLDSLRQAVERTESGLDERASASLSLAWQYRRLNMDSGFYYVALAQSLLQAQPNDSLHTEGEYIRASLLRYQRDFAASIKVFEQCLRNSLQSGDKNMQARVYYSLAIANNEAGNYEAAIQQVQSAYGLFKEQGVKERQAGALNVWATILKSIERHEEAEPIYLEGLALAESENIIYQIEPISNNLATNYVNMGRLDEALVYYQKALGINIANGDLHGIGHLKANIANLYFRKQDYAQAKRYFQEALEARLQLGAAELINQTKGQLAAVRLYFGEREASLREMDECLRHAEEKNDPNAVETLLSYFVQSTHDNGLHREASHYKSLQIGFLREKFEQTLDSKVNELNSAFQKDVQDQKIALLSTQNELQAANLSKQRLLLWGGGAILLIVSLLLLAIYRLYRKVAHQNIVIEQALKDKTTLLQEIHHRVKNNLQVISSLLNLQSYKVKDEVAQRALQEGRARVHSMSLIHQSLYRKEHLTGVNLQDYLLKLCSSLVETYQVSEKGIALETDIDPIVLDVESVVPLGLIINELITNALKYAFPSNRSGTIQVRLKEAANALQLNVQDDGIGIANLEEVEEGDSFGYNLINAFKQKLEAELSINNQQGTNVSLLIRNYKRAVGFG